MEKNICELALIAILATVVVLVNFLIVPCFVEVINMSSNRVNSGVIECESFLKDNAALHFPLKSLWYVTQWSMRDFIILLCWEFLRPGGMDGIVDWF